ncbi:hypothetical protein Poli38472_002187 [Pythium oligandrum]|uniref:CCR4-NOT transcription complex subunit 10 n=1 Tax=Pythium oligandrum TaxID=41045 RepID=A0A8K1CGS1_PYTOL|nr:hypothetical protein Poli38472_002187 [Pythium oligandrum]|eukprot:TMW63246.1 hypothetical protein Poli38472_002187 [Pythium oligandrum]
MSGDSARGKDNKSSLAHRAQQKYNAGKYVEAIDALQKLSEEIAPERDVKVQHNLVLAGFVSGKYAPREFEHNLRNLLSALSEDGDKKKGDESAAFSMEREASFIRYNLAASLFQQKQYAAASAVLEVLLRNIEPIDEKVAMHVCFLYLDIILHSSRGCVVTDRERHTSLKKAQSILAYLEKPHGFNGQLVSHLDGDNSTSETAAGTDAETKQQAKKDNVDVVEFRFRLHLYKAKIMLLQSNLKVAKKEVKSALEIFQKEIKARDRTESELPPVVPAGSIGADKTSTVIGHPSLAVQKSTGLFLKANLEYLRSNHKKCIKLLASCVQQAVDESIFLNNMGCIHFQMGQRKAAQSYFARALDASAKTRKAPQEAVITSNSAQYEIMYNNGLQLLLQGDYALAFRCFHASSRLFFNRPKLWLRMGECCTAAFAQQARLAATAGHKSGLIQGIVGSGSHRRVVLSASQPVCGAQDIELPEKCGKQNANNGTAAADGTPKMNLPFAAKCFKNVILLCNQLLEAPKANGSAGIGGSITSINLPSEADDNAGSTEALDHLRQKALVNLAYVYLSMYEPQLAIVSAKELIALPTCTKANRFLARSYAAEALCMLSRAPEATQVLQSERQLMQMAEDYSKEAKISVKTARAAVHVNNATTLVLQGKLSEAEESVSRAVGENSSCRESLELLVYFYLKKGETKKALRVLKEAQVAA